MITRLSIQNYQTHGRLRVDFDPHITTIVGSSDSGKSAVIRALRWVATNQPGGESFIRYGAKGCVVRMVADGRTVTRKRKLGNAVNTYHLDEEEYKAFGRGVPDGIADFLNLPDVCWQGQHDPSFWFGNTAGEVSRQLNAIVDLGVIDVTLKNVASTFNRARTKLEISEEASTEAKAAYVGLDWVDEADADLGLVEDAYDASLDAHQRADALADTVATAAGVRERLSTLKSRADAISRLTEAAGLAVVAKTKASFVSRAVVTAQAAAQAAHKAKPPRFDGVKGAAEAYFENQATLARLVACLEKAKKRNKDVWQLKKNLKNAQKALPPICPMCGRS